MRWRCCCRYATVDHASACAEAWAPAVLNSSLAAMDKTYSMWGRQIPEQARQRAFHGEDLQRDLLLVSPYHAGMDTLPRHSHVQRHQAIIPLPVALPA